MKLLVLFLSTVYHATQGQLVQLSGSDVICPSDVAVFKCTNNRFPSVTWTLEPKEASPFPISFSSGSSDDGSTVNETLNSSPLIFNIALNDSSISVTLTIVRPLLLNETKIMCRRTTLWLNITLQNPSSPFVPNELIFLSNQQIDGIFNFTITWTPGQQIISDYLVAVSPPPLYEFKASAMYTAISLTNSTQYNITISLNGCPDKINTTFVFGKCPLLTNTLAYSILQYNVNISGVFSALISCVNEVYNETYMVECGMDGQWNTDIASVCRNTKTTQTPTEADKELGTEIITFKYPTVYLEEGKTINQVSISILVFVLVIISSFICGSVLTFVIVIISRLLYGVLCRQKHKKRNTSKHGTCHLGDNSMSTCKSPVYEEVELESKRATVDITQNIAYGYTKKT